MFIKQPVLLLLSLIILPVAIAQDNNNVQNEFSDIPVGHFVVKNPALLEDNEARLIYQKISGDMASRYNLSKLPQIKNYQRLKSMVSNVYLATAHGNRYHNIFVNNLGHNYARYLKAGFMPKGTKVFKDSFTVNENGDVFPGTLAVMEKMAPGFNPQSGDWRFSMIMPDGSVFGILKGEDSDKVEFCVECHVKVKQYDYLHFPPEKYQIR